MKCIAIIPARGGSKRIPRKNIKDFLGKPIIAYSIEAALASGLFETVIVSTDDVEIAEIARKYGAKVPFLRSAANANDFATTADVLLEVLNNPDIKAQNYTFACCIYPTSPFVNASLLQKAYNLLSSKGLDTVLPIQRFSFPIQRAFCLKNDKLAWQYPENATVRSQDLPLNFHDTGQFYFFKINALLQHKSLITDNSSGIEIDEMDAHDIDNETDWKIAEFKYKLRNENL